LQSIHLVLSSIPEDDTMCFRLSLTHYQETALRSSTLETGDDQSSGYHYKALLSRLSLLLNSMEITGKDELLAIQWAMGTAIYRAVNGGTTAKIMQALIRELKRLPAARGLDMGKATRNIQAVVQSQEHLAGLSFFVAEISRMESHEPA
jgi:hypothetical protein